MIGLKKQQKIEEANGMHNLPIVPTQATLRGNVGSLAAPIAAQLFTLAIGARECTKRVANGLKNQPKRAEANSMPNLPIVPTQVMLRGNACSLDGPR